MRCSTPRAELALLIHRSLILALINIPCGVCGVYYDPSSPAESYPHNNH